MVTMAKSSLFACLKCNDLTIITFLVAKMSVVTMAKSSLYGQANSDDLAIVTIFYLKRYLKHKH